MTGAAQRVRVRTGGALAVCLVLAACTRDSDSRTTLQLWAMGSEAEAVAALMPQFEREHPDLRVRVQPIPWSAAHEKLLTAYVGGSMPDVFQLGNTWVPELVALRALAPLDALLGGSKGVDPGDYFEGVYATNVLAGTTYAIPWYVDTRLLFYRRDLLAAAGHAQAPRSWDGWLAAMRDVRKLGAPQRHAIFLPVGEWEPPVIFALQLGAELLRDGGRYGNFESAEFRRAFELYLRMFEESLAPGAGAAHSTDPYRDFAAGEFCFYVTGPWNLGELSRRMPKDLDTAWTTAPMPAPQGDGIGTSLAGGASLAIASASEHARDAWRLIEFLSRPEQQIALYRATGDLPARRSAWGAAGLETDARARAFFAQLAHVRPTPQVPEWERIAARIGQHAESAVRGLVAADDALARLNADADEILAKRRSLLEHADKQPGG